MKSNKLVPTAGYIRVSHDEQVKHGFSIEAQMDGLKKYAEERGYIIIKWYIDEGKSARKKQGKRKAYMQLVEDAKQGNFEMIIFKCIDRWFRDIAEYYKTQSILDDKGINWECSEEEYDTTTRDGRWKLHIYLMLAQDEADKTSERINYVFDNKVKNKEAISGSQPYGFKVEQIDGKKRVVKDKEVSPIVDDIFTHFELYHSKKATLFYIQDKYNIEVDYKLITKVLREPRYYGHYKGVDDYIWYGSYITKERFDRIQELMKKNVKERKNRVDYIFTGLLKCSQCENSLTGTSTVKTINKAGEKRRYISYRCNHTYQKGHCQVWGSFSEQLIEKKLIECIEDEINDFICKYELSLQQRKPAKVSTAAIQEEMDRLNRMYQKNRIKEQEYDYEYDRLEKRMEEALKETPKERDLTPLREFMHSDWKNIYHTLTSKEKRALWRSVIDEMTVDVKKKEFTISFI